MSINNNIRIIREIKEISIDDMSKKLNIFNTEYKNIERGSKKISDTLLSKISDIFNMSIYDIENYDSNKSISNQIELDLKNYKISKLTKEYLSRSSANDEIKKDILYKKPILLSNEDIYKYKNNINLVTTKNVSTSDQNIISDLTGNLIYDDSKISSPILINYIESYEYNDKLKTLFYTEVNSNIKEGQRVFIVNGVYDSDSLIKKDKYKPKNDGYKVLYSDKCKIALDIDYTGDLPYKDESIDKFINIYYINSSQDFLYVNRQITTKNCEEYNVDNVEYKFSKNTNNMIFSLINYESNNSLWGSNNGLTGSPGFFVKDGLNWITVTDMSNGELFNSSNVLSEKIQNNKRIKIHGGSFTHSINGRNVYFNEGYVYKWGIEYESDYKSPTYSTWVVDIEYHKPIISLSNFRDGNFDGKWNSGIFGRQNKILKWNSNDAIWNLGTILNTNWIKGKINNIYSLNKSYISELNYNDIYQKSININNNNNGYNYIIDSNILSGDVDNGNFYNTKFGTIATYSVLEEYLNNNNLFNQNFKINKGYYSNCIFNNGVINNSTVLNSISNNTFLNNIKSINSTYKQSIIKESISINDDEIRIIGYDELNAKMYNISSSTHKVYKFYISENDFYKLKYNNSFYLKNILINDNKKFPINFFNKRFKFSTWTEYVEDEYNNFRKLGIEMMVSLSTKDDNKHLYNSFDSFTKIIEDKEHIPLFSIDIMVSLRDINNLKLNYSVIGELPGINESNPLDIIRIENNGSDINKKIKNNIDISGGYMINSDFESGIFENSDWVSGDHIEYNNNNMIMSIVSISNSNILLKLPFNYKYMENSNIFNIGDVVFLNLENNLKNKIPDNYKIIDYTIGSNFITLNLKPINSVILGNSVDIYIDNSDNRYNYVYKTKFNKSKIKSGIFRRSLIKGSLIENSEYNVNDKTFNNIKLIKSLLISDSIFKNNSNILSKATYINSSFVGGDDNFSNGIVYNCIWNGLTFSNGVIRQSNWIDGVFNGGVFYDNRSFNGQGSLNIPYYNQNRINSYYKRGNLPNNRYSWQKGQFNNGSFFKSDWESGEFNSGKFYYSKFYSGIINGGVIGDINIAYSDTQIYNAEINYTIVDNAKLYSTSQNIYGPKTNTEINWYNGIFNNGLFGCETNIPYGQKFNNSTWYNGIFNSGEFYNFAKWKTGTFNNGKFTSGYGWNLCENSNSSITNYSWEDGIFNNGVFGVANTGTNSTWYNGEFNNGEFTGRIWNNGIFISGKFNGSSTYSATGRYVDDYNNTSAAIDPEFATMSNASNFNDSFQTNYYGKWRNGVVSSIKDNFIKDKKIYNEIDNHNYKSLNKKAIFKNVLWESGNFNHQDGEMYNSIWLDGIFEKGLFINSSFNPFVKRNGVYKFNLYDTCYWKNGQLTNSDFYISKWKYGKFKIGNAYGMIWEDGICEYMNAFNIFWESGLWKNGNWYGSYFKYDGNGYVTGSFTEQILKRGSVWSGTQSCHVWNIFKGLSENINGEKIDTFNAAPVEFIPPKFTYSGIVNNNNMN